MSVATFHHDTRLPWSQDPEDQRRLRTIMTSTLVVILLLSLAVPLIKISDRLVGQVQEVPARFARLIVEDKPAPPPPPPVRQEEIQPRPEPTPVPTPEPVVREAPPVTEPRQQVEQPARPSARERAARSGLLALSSELAEMRSPTISRELESRTVQSRAAPQTARTDAPSIAPRNTGGSGGIDTSTLARDTGNTRLAGRETTRLATPTADVPGDAGAGGPAARGAAAGRTSEEIQMVFDQNKGALNAIYNRALRANPALAGKVVLRLTIAPGGEVTECEVVSSELGDPELERRLVARILLFGFGAKDVAATTVTYPIDFFPG